MNKNVMLSISGLHFDGGSESGNLQSVLPAQYFKKNDSHYLIYEEQQEGFAETVKNRIKLKDKLMELTRQGLMRTNMVFEEGKKHMTSYVTPYGNFLLGVETKTMEVQEKENHLSVVVEYALEADGEYLSDCRIELQVKDA